MSFLSRTWFTVAFCLSYILIFAKDWALFFYYPLVKRFHLGPLTGAAPLTGEIGPAMHWYGLLATAGIVALVASLIGKDRWFPKSLAAWLWLAPLAALIGSTILLKNFFL